MDTRIKYDTLSPNTEILLLQVVDRDLVFFQKKKNENPFETFEKIQRNEQNT